MKKILALGLLSITLIACKKETKTITKIDPTTGDTIKIEVAVEEISQLRGFGRGQFLDFEVGCCSLPGR